MDVNMAEQISSLAREVIRLAHDGILINMRFLDVALDKLKLEEREGMGAFVFDGSMLYYDPALLLTRYRKALAWRLSQSKKMSAPPTRLIRPISWSGNCGIYRPISRWKTPFWR